ARIALRDARPAALAHADLDDAERLERAQRVARDDPAHAVTRRDVLLGAEEIARLDQLVDEREARVRHDLPGQRGLPPGREDRAVVAPRLQDRRADHGRKLARRRRIVKISYYKKTL